MKKLSVILLSVVFCLSMASCGNQEKRIEECKFVIQEEVLSAVFGANGYKYDEYEVRGENKEVFIRFSVDEEFIEAYCSTLSFDSINSKNSELLDSARRATATLTIGKFNNDTETISEIASSLKEDIKNVLDEKSLDYTVSVHFCDNKGVITEY